MRPALLLLLLAGCAIPVRRVDRDLYTASRDQRPEAQEVGPIPSSLTTNGRDVFVDADWRKECREVTYRTVKVGTFSETNPAWRLPVMWAATIAWTGIAAGSVALADADTELGSVPFLVALVAVPVATVQWGTSIRTMVDFRPPTYRTREDRVSEGAWAVCGERPAKEPLVVKAANAGGAFELRATSDGAGDGGYTIEGSTIRPAGWRDREWDVTLAVPKPEKKLDKSARRPPAPDTSLSTTLVMTGPVSEGLARAEARERAEAEERSRREAARSPLDREQEKCMRSRNRLSIKCAGVAWQTFNDGVSSVATAANTLSGGKLVEALEEQKASGSSTSSGAAKTTEAKPPSEKSQPVTRKKALTKRHYREVSRVDHGSEVQVNIVCGDGRKEAITQYKSTGDYCDGVMAVSLRCHKSLEVVARAACNE